MSFLHKVLLQVKPPIYEFKRFKGRINIQKPRKPFFTRQLVIDVCKPTYLKKKANIERCSNLSTREWEAVDNPFEHILAKECSNWFNHSHMIAFFHTNPVSTEDKHPVYGELKLQNMHLRTYGKKILKMGLEGTNYEAILKLFESQTQIVFSEAVQVKEFLKTMRKLPQFILLAGIVDGKFLSRNEFVAYASLPSLEVSRSMLCQTLEKSGSHLVQQLSQQQSALVNSLDRYVEMQQKESGVNEIEGGEKIIETEEKGVETGEKVVETGESVVETGEKETEK